MTNIKPLMKRVCAYLIDLFIVLTLASLVSSIPALNKGMNDYQKIYNEYVVEYEEYTNYLTLLEESYEDEEITEEEYIKLAEIETYKEKLTSRYEDNKISKGEYNEIIEEINAQFNEVVNDYNYLISKEGISNSIITLVCTLIYFGIIQYFLKGQTIGKKLLKLKIVSASDKKINIINYLLRSLIVNDVLLNIIGILFLALTSKSVYTQADNIVSIAISVIEAIIIFLVLTREDQRGLHDLLFNTKVVSTEDQQKETQPKKKTKKKVIEADYEEENK